MSVPSPDFSGKVQWRAPGLLAAIGVLAVGAVAGFVRAALVAPLHVPLDPNEGWNAYHAAAAIVSGSPYPPQGSFMTNNYPPLSFYFVGALGSLVGDNVAAGRIASLASFAVVCVGIAIALLRMRAALSAGALAATLFAGTLLMTSDYVGMNDPQLLGHAFQIVGLLCALHRPRAIAYVIASACLFIVGCFVKHNLFVLPAATAVWLCVTDRNVRFRNAVFFVGALLLVLSAGLIATKATLGVNLLRTLNSARSTSLAQMKENVRDWLPVAAIPLFGIVWLSLSRRRDEAVWFVSIYSSAAIVCGILASTGAGVDINAFFDADIALALSAGLTIDRLLGRGTIAARAAAHVFAFACTLPFAMIAWSSPGWWESSFWIRPMQEETALAGRDIAFLRRHRGSAMCEDLTFCYWAGKAATVDVFNLGQQFETGARNPGAFERLLGAHEFAAVELDETVPFPFPKGVKSVFLRNYRVDYRDDDGIFFVQR